MPCMGWAWLPWGLHGVKLQACAANLRSLQHCLLRLLDLIRI